MDQSGLTLGSYQYYTGNSSAQAHQAFIDFFTSVTQLLGATRSNAADYAEKVWQLEQAIAEVPGNRIQVNELPVFAQLRQKSRSTLKRYTFKKICFQ